MYSFTLTVSSVLSHCPCILFPSSTVSILRVSVSSMITKFLVPSLGSMGASFTTGPVHFKQDRIWFQYLQQQKRRPRRSRSKRRRRIIQIPRGVDTGLIKTSLELLLGSTVGPLGSTVGPLGSIVGERRRHVSFSFLDSLHIS